MINVAKCLAAAVAAVALAGLASAQSLEPAARQELKRGDVAGTKMEMVLSVTEFRPGEVVPRHIHHGEEAFYVLQGATVETADGKQIKFVTGAGSINPRDIPHAGFKVVGDTALKLVTVHVIDKGSVLYDTPPK